MTTRSAKSEPLPLPLVVVASPSIRVRKRWKQGLGDTFPVHEVSRMVDLKRAMADLAPDILLLDLTLSQPGGVAAVPTVQRLSPPTKIVLLTRTPNEVDGITALKAGARGYCHQDIAPSLLSKAVEVVRNGEIWIGRGLVPGLLAELASLTERQQRASSANPASRLARLSHRELDVAHLIGSGSSNKEIASRLNISQRTVKAHVTTIFRKLGTPDRLRLALFVVNEDSRTDPDMRIAASYQGPIALPEKKR